jgi:hypothetical protein
MMRYNLWRLTLARARRFYLSLQAFLGLRNLNVVIGYFEPQLRFFIQWLNFLYFMPRVVMDLAHLVYHMAYFPNQELSLKQRVQIYFHRRWESLIRDTLWLVNGILSIFVLTAGLGYLSLYVAALVQFVEVLVNVYILVLGKLQQEAMRQDVLKTANLPLTEKELKVSEELNRRSSVDDIVRKTRLMNSMGVLLCNIMILPCFLSLSPLIPVIGASLSLLVSVIQFACVKDFAALRQTLRDPMSIGPDEKMSTVNSRYLLCLA